MIANHFQLRSLCAFVALSLIVARGTSQVYAGTIDSPLPSIVIQSGVGADTVTYSPTAGDFTPKGDGGDFELSNEADVPGVPSASVTVKELEFNNDPFVLNNFSVTNNLTTPQIFTVFVGLPTTVAAPNVITGSILTSVIDGGLDGAAITTLPGQPLYKAEVDLAPVPGATLQNSPFSVIAPAGGIASLGASFGPLAGPAVTSSIGIQLQFTLTPGDTASILSRFDVVPGTGGGLPEPTTITLGAIMAVVAYGFRGRRAC
jgi:hypothetical protein